MGIVPPVAEDRVKARRGFSSLRHVQPDGAVLIAGADVRFRVQVLKPGFLLLTASGGRHSHADDVQAELSMLHEMDLALQRAGELTVFADLRDTSRLDSESREVATTWMRANRGKLKASHVLVRNKLIEMAMSIVAMVVGGGILKIYSEPKAFLELVRRVAPNLLALPIIAKHAPTS